MAEPATTVRCLLLPLQSAALLVPSNLLAEVISYTAPDSPAQDDEWLMGFASWRGVDVPLVSFESVMELAERPEPGQGSQVAILYGVVEGNLCPYLGMRLQGIPRSVVVSEDMLEEQPGETRPYVRSQVKVDARSALIPDLPALEQAVKAAVERVRAG